MGFPFYVVIIAIVCIAVLAALVKVTDNRRLVGVLFASYIIAVMIITLCLRVYGLGPRMILNPISKYVTLAKSFASDGWMCLSKNEMLITEILLNILLFVPMGFMVPVMHKSFQEWWKMLLLGFAFSLLIECTQLVFHLGCFDTADLLHNTLGAGIGYVFWLAWMSE